MRLADDAAELPHQRHERVAGAGEALVDARAVHQVELRRRGDRLGRLGGNDAELGLRVGQRRLDIEPGLPAVLHAIEGPRMPGSETRGRGRQRVASGVIAVATVLQRARTSLVGIVDDFAGVVEEHHGRRLSAV